MNRRVLDDHPLTAKFVIVGSIILALVIPLSMLRGLIEERTAMRSQAVRTVADGWGGSLTAGGPLLRIPFEVTRQSKTGEFVVETHQLYILADQLEVQASLERSAARRVGIYEVPVFLARVRLTGRFQMSQVLAAAHTASRTSAKLLWADARIRVPLCDARNIRDIRPAMLVDRALEFGPAEGGGPAGVEAGIDLSQVAPDASLPFSMELTLAGSQSVALVPTAADTRVALAADWPDPQFQGAFLPAHYTVDRHGFRADWQVLALNRATPQFWADDEVDAANFAGAAFGVGLYQSVDVYQRSERAVKYALLFIALTFLSFFSWEALGKVRVHAVQYLLIGLALSTFYLLLIAFTEHLPFWLSFWMGAAALVTLLGIYIAGALASVRLGGLVAAIMILVYGLLYVLVLSESYSLLIGAVSLFAVLATVMLATRTLRWQADYEGS